MNSCHWPSVAVAKMCADLWHKEKIKPLLTSFSETSIAAAKKIAPDLPRGYLTEAIPADWLIRMKALDCLSLLCDHEYLRPAQVSEVKAAGYKLLCYTVNELARAKELFAWGVDGIFTDNLDGMLRMQNVGFSK